MGEDPENFDPSKPLGTHSEAASLPRVFCCSSRAYGKLEGKFRKEGRSGAWFNDLGDTGIPQLQDHARDLTVRGRERVCVDFLDGLTHLLKSMANWTQNGSLRNHNGKADDLNDKLKSMEMVGTVSPPLPDQELTRTSPQRFQMALDGSIDAIWNSCNDHIFAALRGAIRDAVEEAPGIVKGWTAPPAALRHSTYKAVCRRGGSFAARSGYLDFNADLVDVLKASLKESWPRVFFRQVPKALERSQTEHSRALEVFHSAALTAGRALGVDQRGLDALIQQIPAHAQSLRAAVEKGREEIKLLQREANRQFTVCIADMMAAVYKDCAQQTGRCPPSPNALP